MQGATLQSSVDTKSFSFADHYEIADPTKPLAEGSFGKVYITQHKSNPHEEFAVKIVDRARLSEKDADAVFREVSVLSECREFSHVVKLIDFFQSPERFYVVQALAQGGDVFERLSTKTSYNENQARDLARNLLEAMLDLHSAKLAHRDLKPENLLLESMLDDAGILVADFGFAAHVPEGGMKTRCGTPAFVAPEVLVADCHYDEQVDMWSTGCLLYMLIGGYPPFQDRHHRGLFRKIRGADFCFHEAYWKNVSLSAKQLISGLLTTDPAYRLSAKQALEHRWLKEPRNQLADNDLSSSVGELKKFKARNALKGAMHAVLWSVRPRFTVPTKQFETKISDWDKEDEAKMESTELSTEFRPTLRFRDVYELGEKIHGSRQAVIYECIRKSSSAVFAVKVWDTKANTVSVLGKSLTEAVLHEVAVLKALKHKHLISIVDFFEEADGKLYLVMERMVGGDVFDRILQRKQYTEKDARDLARILLEAVAHIHQQGIAHRDLKPQNLLLKSKEDDADIKLSDFGFACRVHTPQSLTVRCGTPSYVAPEVLKNIPYDESADLWSVGVILFVLLAGYPPFVEEDQNELFTRIRSGEWQFDEKDWRHISEDAKNVIRSLLVIDPSKRWSAQQCLSSAWLHKDASMLSATDLSASRDTMLQRKRRLVNVTRTVMWMKTQSKLNAKPAAGSATDSTV